MRIIETTSTPVHLCENETDVLKFFNSWCRDSEVTFDWETFGLEYNAQPLLMSMCCLGQQPIVIPLTEIFGVGIPMKRIAEICNEYFPRWKLIAHNAKYDSMISLVNGFSEEALKIYADTLVMVHLVDPDMPKQLEKRVAEDFGYAKKTFDEIATEVLGKKSKWSTIDWYKDGSVLLEPLAGYSGEDAYWEGKLYVLYAKKMDTYAWKIHNSIEIPMIDVLRDAKIRGVLIDVSLLEEFGNHAREELEAALDDIYEECGCVFNLNSPKQKKSVFFDKMKLPVLGATRKGEPSTDSKTYKEWSEMGYEIGNRLNKYSELNKLLTGYIDAIPNIVDEHNVLRGDMNSCGTATGRMSSSNPNLQNQPNNHDFPIREAFIPRPGYVFVNYDYSQLELRVMAHMSRDEKFMHIFLTGGDPHGDVAKRCGITRKQAKVMNFGVLYGMGVKHFAETFKVEDAEAIKMVEDYHKTYVGFAHWKEQTEKFAQKHGYVRNLFGRKRLLPEASKDPFSRDKKKFYAALRQSVNTIIQGTGADIMKLATIATVKEFRRKNLDAHLLIQVHDENLFEVRRDIMIECEKIVSDCMENTVKLVIPLLADGKIIDNWGEMKDSDVVSVPFRFDYTLYSGLLR